MAAASSEALTSGAVSPMEAAPGGTTARPETHEGSGSEAGDHGKQEPDQIPNGRRWRQRGKRKIKITSI